MTRINLVEPSSLHQKHLLAEYRELPRVFALVQAAELRGLRPGTAGIPAEFCLGTGHVKFFYNKLQFLTDRFYQLVTECKARGFNIAHTQPPFVITSSWWWGNYTPTPQAIALSAARIKERTPK